jgi:hypothetical protein
MIFDDDNPNNFWGSIWHKKILASSVADSSVYIARDNFYLKKQSMS